jgi:enterobactin synthetase component D
VAQCSLAFSSSKGNGLLHEFPGIALPESFHCAVCKRQAEFLAGRLCAREALRSCAPEHLDTPIAVGNHGQPLWPSGIVGSITHSRGFASAALARTRDARGVGVDVEQVMTDDRAASLLERIAAREEICALVDASGWTIGMALTFVFSAKESVFKCLYPEVRRYFDFRDVSVISVDLAVGCFAVRLLETLAPALSAGLLLEGCFERGEHRVCTALVLRR